MQANPAPSLYTVANGFSVTTLVFTDGQLAAGFTAGGDLSYGSRP